MTQKERFFILRIIFFYILFSIVWIFSTDWLLASWISDTNTITQFQNYKGTLFILLSAGFLAFLIHNEIIRNNRIQKALDQKQEDFEYLFLNNPLPMWVYSPENLSFLAVNEAAIDAYGYSREEFLNMTIKDIRPEEDIERLIENLNEERPVIQHSGKWAHRLKSGEIINVEITSHTLTFGGRPAVLVVAENITARVKAEREQARLVGIIDQASESIVMTDEDGIITYINPYYSKISGFTAEEVVGLNTQSLSQNDSVWTMDPSVYQSILENNTWKGTLVSHNKKGSPYYEDATFFPIRDDHGVTMGYASVKRDITDRVLREHELEVIANLSSSLRIMQTRAEMLPTILDTINRIFSTDGAAVCLYNRAGSEVEYSLGKGTMAYSSDALCMPDDDFSKQLAAASYQVQIAPGEFIQTTNGSQKQMNMYVVATSFISQGNILGILWVGRPEIFQQSELHLLESIADLAANTFQRACLYEDTRQMALTLEEAYEATIVGWAKALELRDQETEGHSRRVADLTLRIASQMGIPTPQLAQIRRGAVLHDIGKMAIPDSILLKPDHLDPNEWILMKKHTVFGYDMLRSVKFLEPALDIPRSHHEKWDGTGYPDGLKGEEIPLSARIFAAVDIWDALHSDRPYRKAWETERVLAYLREITGTHLDPAVMDVFFQVL